MKRLVILLAAALVAVSVYAVTAPAGEQTSALQLNSLAKRVTVLEQKTKALQTFVNGCLRSGGVVGVSQFGNPSAGNGYDFLDTVAKQETLTTALDGDSQHPDVILQTVKASCVSSAALRRGSHALRHASRAGTP